MKIELHSLAMKVEDKHHNHPVLDGKLSGFLNHQRQKTEWKVLKLCAGVGWFTCNTTKEAYKDRAQLTKPYLTFKNILNCDTTVLECHCWLRTSWTRFLLECKKPYRFWLAALPVLVHLNSQGSWWFSSKLKAETTNYFWNFLLEIM